MFYLRDVLLFAIFLCVVTFAARAVWRRVEILSRLESWALVCGSSLGSGGLLVWLCGSVFGVGKSLALCLFVVPALCLAWSHRGNDTKSLAQSPQSKAPIVTSSTRSFVERASWRNMWRELALDEKLLALYTIAICATTFLLSLAPPNGADYDSLVYHLAAPAQYIRAGRIIELPYDHHTYFPFATEMLYLVGLLWSGPVLAKLFHWLMLPLICALLFASSARWVSRRAGLAAAAIWCSLPLVQLEATTAYIDLALVAFTLGAMILFFRWREEFLQNGAAESESGRSSTRCWRWMLLCGAWCGFCLGTKYLGVLTFAWLGLAALFVMGRARRFDVKSLLAFAFVTLFIGGGWYARNIFWTGNPTFPFAYEVFGGEGWTPEMARRYAVEQSVFGFGKTPFDWLALPWRLSMSPLNVAQDNSGNIGGQPFWPLIPGLTNNGQTGLFEVRGLLLVSFIGPLLLALGAPTLLVRRKPQWIVFCGASALVFALLWAASSQTIRYALPIFMMLCAFCGWGFAVFGSRSRVLRWAALLATFAWLMWSAIFVNYTSRSTWNVVAGKRAPDEYLSRTVPPYRALQWMNANLPRDAVVAVYAEPRGFYLEREFFWADPYQNTLFRSAVDAPSLLNALKKYGATHILLNRNAVANFGVGGAPFSFDGLAPTQLQVVYETKDYQVWEIK